MAVCNQCSVCHLKKLNGWLFSINPEKVRPDLKDRVIQYQEECFEALYNYWHFGKAERKTTTDERTGLRQAVSALVSKKGLIYSDAYSLIHQRFNVEHIDELTPEQVGMAVEYVHKIYLEGELIIDEPKQNIATPNDEAVRIAKYLVRARAFAKEVEVFHRKLYEDLGISRYVKNDIAGKAYDIAHEFNVWLDPFIVIKKPYFKLLALENEEEINPYKISVEFDNNGNPSALVGLSVTLEKDANTYPKTNLYIRTQFTLKENKLLLSFVDFDDGLQISIDLDDSNKWSYAIEAYKQLKFRKISAV
ncbi:phage antirepressor N-terminal domain-containing protein [Glaesserella parasuis]|nr:phage antirepressor N-terminal domain-containing protein [Glaesserella parasuis]MDP0243697.1 phage antirepressor N-terminal domain-containing protein [Glaesserella parasuis]